MLQSNTKLPSCKNQGELPVDYCLVIESLESYYIIYSYLFVCMYIFVLMWMHDCAQFYIGSVDLNSDPPCLCSHPLTSHSHLLRSASKFRR